MTWRRRGRMLSWAVSVAILALSPLAYAQQSASPNYQVNEVFMGAGGELEACSGSYCAKQSAGEIAAGNTASAAFRAQGGFNTDREPYIAFSVAGSTTDLGVLSTLATAYTTGTFAIKTYLSSGYVVALASPPPTSNGLAHVLATPNSPTPSAIGTEQFGINVVENTTGCGAPADFGADPVQVPDNTFSFGEAEPDYANCGEFKYTQGDTIASSDRSSGETDFTLSFIYNISSITPNGEYTYNGVLVATSTY